MASKPIHGVSFHHPLIQNDLIVHVNPDQVTWAYGLNTAVYPTFGGEVVQVLSVYFDDMTIAGTVSSYRELELIYSWFITYMQNATQGQRNPSYDQQPVTFTYKERGWTFQIWPMSLPSFTYGRDVVAPTWQLTAAVHESDSDFTKDVLTVATANTQGGVTFGTTTADFGPLGDLVHNPWASPDADPSVKGGNVNSWVTQTVKGYGDTFAHFVSDWAQGNITSLPQFNTKISSPPSYVAAVASGGKNQTVKTDKTHHP